MVAEVQAYLACAAAEAELQKDALLDLRQSAFQALQRLDQQLRRPAQTQKTLGQQFIDTALQQLLRGGKISY